ncbi:insulin-like 3 [Ascaphus truei]|uniref:insulin-like 3 n=1 Tax=Ascaphus truei TaxID=8439 RepID=UPI003F598F0E
MALHPCALALMLALLLPPCCQGGDGPALGTKLCGREFIRTVVISCGGSRWKRYSPEPGLETVNPYRDLLEWLNKDFMEDPEHLNSVSEDQSMLGLSFPALPDPSMEQIGGALFNQLGGEEQQGDALRMRRSTGPAGSCCKNGCTKSEIMKFC